MADATQNQSLGRLSGPRLSGFHGIPRCHADLARAKCEKSATVSVNTCKKCSSGRSRDIVRLLQLDLDSDEAVEKAHRGSDSIEIARLVKRVIVLHCHTFFLEFSSKQDDKSFTSGETQHVRVPRHQVLAFFLRQLSRDYTLHDASGKNGTRRASRVKLR
jgi:hypothetical protein